MSLIENQFSLASMTERRRRLEMLDEPQVEPLSRFLQHICNDNPDKCVLHVDPRDGGIHCKALFLMLAAGTNSTSSGFLSIDNTDGTAKNFRELFRVASIPRKDFLLWNIIPWTIGKDSEGNREMKDRDIEKGLQYLGVLFKRLQQLKVIVLLGKNTHIYKDRIQQFKGLPILEAAHPTPTVFNCHRKVKAQTQATFLEVARHIRD
jgi:hypothetical protein